MAKQIATISTVFAACERLEETQERWNREDVRNAVGGGGYVVIDPLIRAWRALKPLREAAPNTPAELLHQVAVSIDAHITQFTTQSDERQAQSESVFNSVIAELSDKLDAQEKTFAEKAQALEEAMAEKSALADELEREKDALTIAHKENARISTENDGLLGRLARMENEYEAALAAQQSETRKITSDYAQEREKLGEDHKRALAEQRRELTEAAEQAENRLMVLLDNARQEANKVESNLSTKLEQLTQQLQSQRDSMIALKTQSAELNRQNQKLELEQTARAETNAELQAALEEQKAAAAALAQEFDDYKRQHALGGELGELRQAVARLQDQLQSHPRT